MEAPNKNLLGQQFEAEESSAPLLNGSNTDIENAGEKKSSTIMYSNPKRKSNLKDIEYAFSYDRTRDPVVTQLEVAPTKFQLAGTVGSEVDIVIDNLPSQHSKTILLSNVF